MAGNIVVGVSCNGAAMQDAAILGRMPDAELEALGNLYRSMCGANDVLIHRGRVVLFGEFVICHRVKAAIDALFAGRRAA